MTQRLRLPLLIILLLVLQTTVLGRLRVAGVAPDVMVLLAVAAGIVGGPERGAALGFAAGFSIDLFLQTPLGLSALVFSLLGYSVGLVTGTVVRAAWWIPVGIATVASAAGQVLFAVLGSVVGQTQLVTARLVTIALVVALFNALFSLPALRLTRWALTPDPTLARGYAG